MEGIGNLGAAKVFVIEQPEVKKQEKPTVILAQAPDTVDLKGKPEKAKAPKIGFFRLATGFITKKQIAQINESGKLPDNAKFVQNGWGGYTIQNDIFGITPGTKTLPAGFEVKRGGIFGQAIVVPKGTEGLLIR